MNESDHLRRALVALGDGAGDELVPPEALARCGPALAMFASGQPELVLELHVGAPRPVVDLTLRLYRTQARSLARHLLPEPVRRVVDAFMSDGAALSRVPFIEFEFDLESEPALPWIGPAVEPELRRGPVWIQEARDRGARYPGPAPADAAFVLRLLGELGGVDPRTAERVRAFVAALPRWGILSQLALLGGRPSAPRDGVRVFVSVPIDCLDETLARAGWTGDAGRVHVLRERFAPASRWIDVDFGISARGADPTLGFYREFRAPRSADSSLRGVLDTVAELSLTTPERLAMLRAWIGRNEGRLDRMISFKVAVLPEGLRPKVYLSALDFSPAQDGLSSGQIREDAPA